MPHQKSKVGHRVFGTATEAFDTMFSDDAQGDSSNIEYISYFMSDGAPTDNGGNPSLADNAVNSWVTYSKEKDINSYVIGIGSNIDDDALEYVEKVHNVDTLGSGSAQGPLIIADEEKLQEELLNTIPTSFGGSLVTNGRVTTIDFGADGGYIHSIEFTLKNQNGTEHLVKYQYDPVNGEITNTDNNVKTSGSILVLEDTSDDYDFGEWGKLIFNFSTGEYTYYPDDSLVEGDSFSFQFVVADHDNDLSQEAQATLKIVDAIPVANDDSETLMPGDAMAEGNLLTGVGTDGGIAASSKSTPFVINAGGVDTVVDNAAITKVIYKGQEYSTQNQAQWPINLVDDENNVVGKLSISSNGYFSYEPVTVYQSNVDPIDAVNVQFSSISSLSDIPGVVFSSPDAAVQLSGGMIGVGNNTIGAHERLVIEFSKDEYPDGVNNIDLGISTVNDRRAMTITLYQADGQEVAQLYKSGADNNASGINDILASYTNISRLEIDAGSSANNNHAGKFVSLSFDKAVPVDDSVEPLAPQEITYILEDDDGQFDTATLSINTMQNFMVGTELDDVSGQSGRALSGSSANDYIDGLEGDDVIDGAAGHDILLGGEGDDTLRGGEGHDLIRGNAGHDLVQGGSGNDVLHGDDGDDIVEGGSGSDELYGDAGSDRLVGAAGSDLLAGGAGNDLLTGGETSGLDNDSDTFAFNIEDLLDGQTVQTDILTDFTIADAVSGSGDQLDLSELVDFTADDVLTWQTLSSKGLEAAYDDDTGQTTLTFTTGTDDSDADKLMIVLKNTNWADTNGTPGITGDEIFQQLISNSQIIV